MPKFDIIDDRFGEPLPVPPTTATNSLFYYVSQTVNGCESGRDVITVTVVAVPTPPCGNHFFLGICGPKPCLSSAGRLGIEKTRPLHRRNGRLCCDSLSAAADAWNAGVPLHARMLSDDLHPCRSRAHCALDRNARYFWITWVFDVVLILKTEEGIFLLYWMFR